MEVEFISILQSSLVPSCFIPSKFVLEELPHINKLFSRIISKIPSTSILMRSLLIDIIDFAEKYDPQLFHTDEKSAKNSIFGGLIASSLHTLSACTRTVVEAQGNVAILSGISMHEVKMHNPVRPGDVLSVKAWWAELKKSRSKPDRGLASLKCNVTNQRDEPIIEYGYCYLIACSNFEMPQIQEHIN